MSTVSLVLFDVNGVLYDYDKASRVAYLARLGGGDPATIDAAIWGSGFEDRGDAGDMDAAGYLAEFGARLGHTLSVEDWTEAARVALTPLAGMLSLARRVGEKARLGVLTNNNRLVRERMDTLYPHLRPIFGDTITASSEFRLRKPDPDVYRRCLARLRAVPAETLFIDDSAANVAGAEQAGLQGHVHTDEATLTARLASLGLV